MIGNIFGISQERVGQILKSLNIEETSIFKFSVITEYFKNPNQKNKEIAKKVGCSEPTVSLILKNIPLITQGDC